MNLSQRLCPSRRHGGFAVLVLFSVWSAFWSVVHPPARVFSQNRGQISKVPWASQSRQESGAQTTSLELKFRVTCSSIVIQMESTMVGKNCFNFNTLILFKLQRLWFQGTRLLCFAYLILYISGLLCQNMVDIPYEDIIVS